MTFEPDTVQWRGVHHLALVTTDMDATVRFYAGVLDARLVATIATDAFKHYFFDFGTGTTIAFFEYKGQPVETFSGFRGFYPETLGWHTAIVDLRIASRALLRLAYG